VTRQDSSLETHRTPDRRKYWDGRILDWEAGRYDGRAPVRLGPAELLASVLPRPTRDRQRICIELLGPFIADSDIVELGCGTGRMARRFLEAGCKSYLGTDHSSVAIDAARKRYLNTPAVDKIRFEVCPAHQIPLARNEIIVSLGVLDWLTDEELEELFRRQGSRDFFHSFSEHKLDLMQLGHRFCRAADRVLRPNAVRPRYMSANLLIRLMPAIRNGQIVIYRDAALRFASFFSSLSLPDATLVSSDGARALT
jgi:SAM-dependent methyltransferase